MKFRRIAFIAAALAFTAAPLQAAYTTVFSGTYTGGSSFSTTASLSLAYEWQSGSVYLVQINATNLGIYGEVYKTVGLFDVPDGITVTGEGYTAPTSPWKFTKTNGFEGDRLTPNTFAYTAPPPPATEGLQKTQSGTFTFRMSGITVAQIEKLGVGVHAISGYNGCSTKMGVMGPDGTVIDNFNPAGDPDCVPTTVPEPGTVVLLATGFLGLLGMGYVRSRKDDEKAA